MTGEARSAETGLSVRVDLPGDATAAREARGRARSLLAQWELAHLVEPVTLIVSELVGNAVRHGRPPVSMTIALVPVGVKVGVHDEQPDAFRPGASALPAQDAEGGRGMFLVDALSSSTGVEHVLGDGKTIWSIIER